MNRQQIICVFAKALEGQAGEVFAVEADERKVEAVLGGKRIVRISVSGAAFRATLWQLQDGRMVILGKMALRELADPGSFTELDALLGFKLGVING